jgi:hypothetical protein
MGRSTILFVASLLAGALACVADDRTPAAGAPPAEPDIQRRLTTRFDTAWILGASERDSVFVDPWYVTAGGGGVFVSDAERGLLAFSDSGAPRWNTPGVLGPLTVLSDTVLAAMRGDGSVVLLDVRTGREIFSTASGVQQAQALCAVSNKHLLIAGSPDGLTMVDRWGGTPVDYPFPWRALRDSSSLHQQSILAAAAGHPDCVIALVVGNEFAITHGADSTTFHPYVEAITVPPVRRTVETAGDEITTTTAFVSRASAAKSVAVDDSLIYIAFGGATPNREGLVDVYDRASGAYRTSVKVGVSIRGLATGGGVLFVLHSHSAVPALAALRLHALLPPS